MYLFIRMTAHLETKEFPVIIENGSFKWTDQQNQPILSNLNVRIRAGELVAVVGATGAGKSSLLSALIGQMVKFEGVVNVTVRTV